MGTIAITAKANLQFRLRSRILAPTIRNTEEAIETIACETKDLMASTSVVRLVSSLEGLAFSIKA
ncbi:hypothetical protein D3C85_1405470 [compost metagenome]